MAAAAYELLVLGGGSGGLAGARRAAELGARVALVEPRRLGGTCVNVGCVPKKVMWNTAVHAEFIHDHADYGFETLGVKFNWRTIKEKRDAYVRRLNDIYENNAKKAHIDIIRGYGKFTADPEPTIEVDGKKYTAPHILIATGGRPAVPSDSEIPGASLGMTSDGFFDLEEMPRRSVIVGAGYIAVEITGILSTLGSKSSLLIRQDKPQRILYLEGNVSYVDFYLHQPSVAAVFITSYLLIFLLCMVGNGGVCFIILRSKHMRTVTNLFILNLAVSDLLVGLFCMPTTLLDNIIAGWPFGSLVCKMSGMVQGISVSASVFTLVAIAVDRFRCIVHPFKQKLTIPTAVAIIAVIWILAVAIMCPSAVLLQVQEEKHFRVLLGSGNATRPVYWCREEWPDPGMRKIYTTVLFANIYLAPLSLIVIMYARISISLSHTARPGAGKHSQEQRHGVWKRKQKVIKMLIVVTLLFTLSWLPLWTLMLLSDYASLSDLQLQLINIYIYPFAHWLAFFNSSINPIIYGFSNENFRRGFQAVFRLQLCSREVCCQPGPGNAILPAARCQMPQDQAPQKAKEEGKPVKKGNWVNNQQDLIMEDLKEPCNNGIK